MARAGMPEDRSNLRTDPCGCHWVYVAATPISPQGWVRTHTCFEHSIEPPKLDA
jgi:hypothetical protein